MEEARQMRAQGGTTAEKWIDEVIRKETPLEPDDVLAIWNSTVGQNINKALEEYIKRLTTAEKKAIVKEALKGRIHRDLDRFKKVEEVKTGKKVKITVQLEKSKPLKEKYRKLIEEEIKKRRLLDAEVIKNELREFSLAWKPFDPAKNPKYTKCRFSSVELYADALSGIITNPAYLKQKAPRFYEGYFNYLERKPEVKVLYEKIQNEIRGGTAERSAVIRLREGFAAREREWAEQLVKNRRQIFTKDAIGTALIDRYYAILRRVKLIGESNLPAGMNPRFALEDMIYTASEIEGYLAEVKHKVLSVLDDANISPVDLGEYLYHRRVATDRAELANPEGFTPERSRKRIREMEDYFGPELKAARDAFYKIRQEYFIDKVVDSEMYSPELTKAIQDSENYATFDIVGHMEKNYGREATGKIFRQIGTFNQTGNPFVATIMKDNLLMYAVNRNNAAKSVSTFMLDHFPQEVKPADLKWNGRCRELQPSPDRDMGLLFFMDKGEMKGHYVPKYIAESFEHNPLESNLICTMLRYAAKPFKMIFTEMNPGFWLFNTVRDYKRAARNLPGGSYMNFLPYYMKSIKPAFRSTFGIPDAVADQMRKNRMFISIADYRGQDPADTQLERILKRHGLVPTAWNNRILKPFGAFFDKMSKTAQGIERIPKIAGYKYLMEKRPQGMSPEQIAHEIRGNIGSPAFLRQGSAAPIYNNLLLFSNAIKEGWRGDIDFISKHKAESSWKFAKYSMLPKVIMFAAGAGLLGYETKKIMDGVSNYDKTNYTTIPLGTTPKGKSVYIRVPQDELSRMMGGVAWKLLDQDREKIMTDLFDYMAGQAPTVHPAFQMIKATVEYASGRNPYDSFRGREVIPDQVFQADDHRSKIAFAKWASDQAGGGIVYRFGSDRPDEIKTELEKVLGYPILNNTIGRFVKVSDQGIREDIRALKEKVRKTAARESLDAQEAMEKLIDGQKLDSQDIEAISKKAGGLNDYVLKLWAYRYGNVMVQEYLSAQSKEEKAAVLKKMGEIKPIITAEGK
jgi:hypothetical protein